MTYTSQRNILPTLSTPRYSNMLMTHSRWHTLHTDTSYQPWLRHDIPKCWWHTLDDIHFIQMHPGPRRFAPFPSPIYLYSRLECCQSSCVASSDRTSKDKCVMSHIKEWMMLVTYERVLSCLKEWTTHVTYGQVMLHVKKQMSYVTYERGMSHVKGWTSHVMHECAISYMNESWVISSWRWHHQATLTCEQHARIRVAGGVSLRVAPLHIWVTNSIYMSQTTVDTPRGPRVSSSWCASWVVTVHCCSVREWCCSIGGCVAVWGGGVALYLSSCLGSGVALCFPSCLMQRAMGWQRLVGSLKV